MSNLLQRSYQGENTIEWMMDVIYYVCKKTESVQELYVHIARMNEW